MFTALHLARQASVILLTAGLLWSSPAAAQQPPGWTCQIPAQSGRIIINFNNKLIRSSQTEALATDGPVSAAIPAGTYALTLESFDSHSSKTDPLQPHEQYFLIFSNGQTTNSISDLPDAQDSLIEQVETALIVTSNITSITARSTKWPESATPKEINSIVPVCAAFDPITPTPTPSAPPTGGDVGPDCCPGPDEPVPTPTPKIAPPRIKGATSAATPTPSPTVAALRRLPSAGYPLASVVLSGLLLTAAGLAGRLIHYGTKK